MLHFLNKRFLQACKLLKILPTSWDTAWFSLFLYAVVKGSQPQVLSGSLIQRTAKPWRNLYSNGKATCVSQDTKQTWKGITEGKIYTLVEQLQHCTRNPGAQSANVMNVELDTELLAPPMERSPSQQGTFRAWHVPMEHVGKGNQVARASWHKVVHQVQSEAWQLLPYIPGASVLLPS